jgi:hypothetical protein
MKTRIVIFATILGALANGVVHADPTLALTPASAIQGEPGQTVGWGFTIDNDTGYYLLVDSSNFCGIGGDPFFTDCTTTYDPPTEYGPAYGVYDDYIATNLTDIAPLSTLSVSFDPVAQTGVGAYVIDPAAPVGSVDQGNIFVSYMEFSGDPLAGGTQVSGDIEISASASVDVVPEPAVFSLTGFGVLLVAWAIRRSTRRSR